MCKKFIPLKHMNEIKILPYKKSISIIHMILYYKYQFKHKISEILNQYNL